MTFKAIALTAAITTAVVIPTVLFAQAKPAQAAAPLSIGTTSLTNGRFVMVTPPQAAESVNYNNFTWVLDTQTGRVRAYRMAQLKSEDGKSTTWGVASLTDFDAPVR